MNKILNELNILKISKIKSEIQNFRRWKKGRFFYLHMVHFLLVFFSMIFSWKHWVTRYYDKWYFLLEEKVYFEASWLKFRGQFFVKCLNSLNQSWWPRRTQMFLSWFVVFCELSQKNSKNAKPALILLNILSWRNAFSNAA